MSTAARGVIRWEDPPHSKIAAGRSARTRRPDPYPAVAAELRARPNSWAVVGEGVANGVVSGLATSIVRGLYPSWEPAGAFEAVTRKRNGITSVYARYVGVDQPD